MFPTLCNAHNIRELITVTYCELCLNSKPQLILFWQSVFFLVKMNPKKAIDPNLFRFVKIWQEKQKIVPFRVNRYIQTLWKSVLKDSVLLTCIDRKGGGNAQKIEEVINEI